MVSPSLVGTHRTYRVMEPTIPRCDPSAFWSKHLTVASSKVLCLAVLPAVALIESMNTVQAPLSHWTPCDLCGVSGSEPLSTIPSVGFALPLRIINHQDGSTECFEKFAVQRGREVANSLAAGGNQLNCCQKQTHHGEQHMAWPAGHVLKATLFTAQGFEVLRTMAFHPAAVVCGVLGQLWGISFAAWGPFYWSVRSGTERFLQDRDPSQAFGGTKGDCLSAAEVNSSVSNAWGYDWLYSAFFNHSIGRLAPAAWQNWAQ